jgi:hypothetical protein
MRATRSPPRDGPPTQIGRHSTKPMRTTRKTTRNTTATQALLSSDGFDSDDVEL